MNDHQLADLRHAVNQRAEAVGVEVDAGNALADALATDSALITAAEEQNLMFETRGRTYHLSILKLSGAIITALGAIATSGGSSLKVGVAILSALYAMAESTTRMTVFQAAICQALYGGKSSNPEGVEIASLKADVRELLAGTDNLEEGFDDAVQRLEKLGIVERGADDRLHPVDYFIFTSRAPLA
ncbi:hypothetical protein D3C77_111300 [compost metagenome]|jgi:hypothetical protein